MNSPNDLLGVEWECDYLRRWVADEAVEKQQVFCLLGRQRVGPTGGLAQG
jgi:hypothetical protein